MPACVRWKKRIPETGRAAVRVEAMPALDLTVVPFLWAGGSDRSVVGYADAAPVHELDVKAHDPILTSTANVL